MALNFYPTYRYGKSDKNQRVSVETGSNREIVGDFSGSQPKYIVRSDGLMRVSYLQYVRYTYTKGFYSILRFV